jgi:hypothetical protein
VTTVGEDGEDWVEAPWVNSVADPHFNAITPEKLLFESGYSVQTQIRMDQFPEEKVGSSSIKILDVKGTVVDFQWPHILCSLYLKDNPTAINDQFEFDDHPMVCTKEEILGHIDYPSVRHIITKRKRRGDNGDNSSEKSPLDHDKKGDDDDDGGDDNDGDDEDKPSRNPYPWQESIKNYLPNALNTALKIHRLKEAASTGEHRDTDPRTRHLRKAEAETRRRRKQARVGGWHSNLAYSRTTR